MYRELIPIYGPLSINSFGLMIALGVLVFVWRISKNPLRKMLMTSDQFLDVLMVGIFLGVVGARALCMATEWNQLQSWHEIMHFWQGGYSVLGAIISNACFLPLYLWYRQLPVLASLDLFALYAPLMQAIARFGCLFAGCCYGKITTLPWAIQYTDTNSIAPLHVPLHPTQIYSSLLLICIYLFLNHWVAKRTKQQGQILFLYLALTGIERFLIDFLRDDQEFFAGQLHILSIYQWLALAVTILASTCFLYITFNAYALKQHSFNESL